MIDWEITRNYYVPLGAYTYNDCYIPSYHKRPRIILKGPLHHFKRLCYVIYRATDRYHGDTRPWMDKESMYDIKGYFGFNEETLLCKNGNPRKAKDTDSLFKLTIDSLFEYAGLGDQYLSTVHGVRVITKKRGEETCRHRLPEPLHFTNGRKKMGREFLEKYEKEHDDSFFMLQVRKVPLSFDSDVVVPGLSRAVEIMQDILPQVREEYEVSWEQTP